MEIRKEDVRRYIPEWDDNREKSEDEQIVLHIAPMTGGELRAAYRVALTGKGDTVDKSLDVLERIIKKRVVKLENCVDILDREIENGSDLWDRGPQELVDEAHSALTEISTLRAGLKND